MGANKRGKHQRKLPKHDTLNYIMVSTKGIGKLDYPAKFWVITRIITVPLQTSNGAVANN